MNFHSLEDIKKAYPKFIHASNLLAKKNKLNLTTVQQHALPKIEQAYIEYINNCFDITGYSDADIKQKVKLLNTYYDFIHLNNWDNIFTSQSKFRSTILEEFLFILFNSYIHELCRSIGCKDSALICGASKAYTNMYFYAKDIHQFVRTPEIGINMKDQDFAIYRELSIHINEEEKKVVLPVVAIEAKTYLDKTMLEGSIATADKIKSGNPYSKFFIVTETYEVDLKVDPAYSRIDQIYVLRKSNNRYANNPICDDVVITLMNDVKNHMIREWSNIGNKLKTSGLIL